MKFYAQLNDENLVVGISQLAGEVENEKLIPIPEFNEDLLFRKYENGNFSEEKYYPEIEPTSHTTIEEQIYAENLYQTALLEIQMIGGE